MRKCLPTYIAAGQINGHRRLERAKEPTAGAYYAGAMYGYEDCADDLAMLLKEVLAAEIQP